LSKPWFPGVGWDHKRGKPFLRVFTLNKIFSRTICPISIKLATNHPWVKGIQVVQRKGQVLFKGEIITKMKKIG
jgi:hypothetical protein